MSKLSILLPLSGSIAARLPSTQAMAKQLDALLAPAFSSGASSAEISLGEILRDDGPAFGDLQFFINLANQEQPGLIEMCARTDDGRVAQGHDFAALFVRGARAFNANADDEALHARIFIAVDVARIRAEAGERTEEHEEVPPSLVTEVLREHWSEVANTQGRSFEEMAAALVGDLDAVKVQTAQCSRDEVVRQLRELGVLEPPSLPEVAPANVLPADHVVIHSAAQDAFWSNDHGWVDLSRATRFVREELGRFGLPQAAGVDASILSLVQAATQAIVFGDEDVPDYARAYSIFKLVHAPRIAALSADLQPIKDSAHWRLVDGLKTLLGETAANDASDDRDEQDRAITAAEDWVSQCCAAGGFEEDVAMALYLHGDHYGEVLLREQATVREVAR